MINLGKGTSDMSGTGHFVKLSEKDLMLLAWALKRYESPNEFQREHAIELGNQFSDMLADY